LGRWSKRATLANGVSSGERAYHETPARFLDMKKPRGVSPAGLGKLGDLSI